MANKQQFFKPTNDLSYRQIAELYSNISSNKYEKNADFVLPQNPKFSAFGNKIAFCQVINTWFEKNPKSKVRIYDNLFPQDETVQNHLITQLINKAELPTLLAIAYGVKSEILGYTNKTNNYTLKFIRPLEDRLIFDYRELSGVSQISTFSNEYFQLHPDFFDQEFFAYNLVFYKKIGPYYWIKGEEAINQVTKKLFNRIESLETEFTIKWLKEVQTYFYEIFDNAYKWGRPNWLTGNDNTLVEKSNRVFFTSSKNYTNLSDNSNPNLSNLDLKLIDFSKRNSKTGAWGSNTKILELSILDNGLGIVQTMQGSDIRRTSIAIIDEYTSLANAFLFGKTSDKTDKANLRGIGLNKVIDKAKNVFLIIRTGHLHLFRDFSKFPLETNESFYLFDSGDSQTDKKSFHTKIMRYPWSQGTLFTFIIPL